MLATLQYVLNSFLGGVYISLISNGFSSWKSREVTGLKRDKIPQLRQVRSNELQPGLYDGL